SSWGPERFDYTGRHYRYQGVFVTPKPAHPIPILVGGFVDEAVKRAGRIGDGYISSRVPPERARESFAMAAEARASAGMEGPPIVALLHNAFVTEDPDGDWPMVRAGIGHQLGTYSGWRAGTDVPGVPLEIVPPDEDTIRKSTAYGTPDDVVDYLAPLVEILTAYPESHLILRLHYPGMTAEPAARAIELMAGEVAPRLRALAR
ncbi:MAG TPA: LLM class flavin-dependent oxidoreductase, partial [Actinomycetota bacterium]|nr:LLM class flavin-dependent oxidoreductase [Actinomycetota bacterium]